MVALPVQDAIPSKTLPLVAIALILLNTGVFLFSAPLPRWPLGTTWLWHDGWGHLLGNVWLLWIFGETVEDRLGHVRFLFLYVAAGLAATIAPVAGASGAIAGVFGAYFALFPYSRILTLVWLAIFVDLVEVPALFYLGLWLVLQLLFDVGSFGTVGGFIAGMALGLLLRKPERMRIEWIER